MEDFIGPLTAEQQRWADEVQACDTAAAVFEPAPQVLRRRELRIDDSLRACALMFLTGDARAWGAARQAVAEQRALAWLDPANLHGMRIDRRRRSPHDRQPDPDWRRFGSDATG